VTSIDDSADSRFRVNGGFFVFRREIFNYMREGEELVLAPFKRLIDQDELLAYQYDGFWQAMDTFKDRQRLEQMYADGQAPWEMVWQTGSAGPGRILEPAVPVFSGPSGRIQRPVIGEWNR
jgi:glucose-1-phosphate cytidylyltransferase